MTILEGLSFVFGLAMMFTYLILISKIYHGWELTEETFRQKPPATPKATFSIIISCRNEAEKIAACLQSVFTLDFPSDRIQVIVVDDHSTDQTAAIARSFEEVTCLTMKDQSGKKAAMTTGVLSATMNYLWFVDADCIIHQDEAKLLDAKIQSEDPDFIACPVIIDGGEKIITRFQFLDNAAMMAITANGIYRQSYFLANGANMVVKKSTFEFVEGFSGNTKVASGDDVFLIRKMVDAHKKVAFLKSRRAAVVTSPEPDFSALMMQRKRWATKTKDYANPALFKIQGFIFCIHVVIILYFITAPLLPINLMIGIFILFIKAVVDYLFLSRMSDFFGNNKALKAFIPAFFLYFIYIFFTGFHALFPKNYVWKGRKVT